MATRSLAEMLRELRHQQGSSLRSAAKEFGVDPSYLSRLERGKKPASDQLLEKASRYYDVPLEQLELAKGELPGDILEILRTNPELVERLRTDYGPR